jgi:hypothetical protein
MRIRTGATLVAVSVLGPTLSAPVLQDVCLICVDSALSDSPRKQGGGELDSLGIPRHVDHARFDLRRGNLPYPTGAKKQKPAGR